MKLIYDNLYDFKPTYGVDNWDRIVEAEKIDAFDDYLENTPQSSVLLALPQVQHDS